MRRKHDQNTSIPQNTQYDNTARAHNHTAMATESASSPHAHASLACMCRRLTALEAVSLCILNGHESNERAQQIEHAVRIPSSQHQEYAEEDVQSDGNAQIVCDLARLLRWRNENVAS